MAPVAPARECAFAVITRVFEQGAYADRALHGEAAGLAARDRQLAMALAYGTVQRKRTLDHILGALCARPLRALEGPVLAALRLGCFQLLLMDGVAEHAARTQDPSVLQAQVRIALGRQRWCARWRYAAWR